MEFINLTPHAIVVTDGETYQPTGTIARVTASFGPFDENGITEQQFGEVENLPAPAEGKTYIVSGMVLSALKGARKDVVAPATGHPAVVRNDKGHIVSVPGFTR